MSVITSGGDYRSDFKPLLTYLITNHFLDGSDYRPDYKASAITCSSFSMHFSYDCKLDYKVKFAIRGERGL